MPITSLKTGQANNVYKKNILCGSVTLLYTQVVSSYMLVYKNSWEVCALPVNIIYLLPSYASV